MLSLVILCYRSRQFAREFVGRAQDMLRDAGIEDYELILVANYVEGTDDDTPQIVRELAAGDERLRCLTEPKQGWMGWDLRRGLAAARGELIGFIDGDGQMPITDVGRLAALIASGDYDLVKTYRTTRGDGFKRKLLSRGFNAFFHVLFPGVKARDMNSKPKLMTRAAYDKLKLRSDGWFIDAEIMIEAGYHRFRVGELPTEFCELERRRSFVNLSASFEFIWGLLRARVRQFFR